MTTVAAKLIRPALLPFLVVTMLVAGIAAAPATVPAPSAPTVIATANPGELRVNWTHVPGAQFYTVGWINRGEFEEMQAAGRDWRDAFHYATIPATYTSHTVKGVKPDANYFTIVGAQTTRFGADPAWSGWSTEVTTTALQTTTPVLPPPAPAPAQALPGIILDPYALLLDETQTGNITARLASTPTAAVTVRFSTGDATAATVSPSAITVTPDTWNIEQNITVISRPDDDTDHENVTITVTATSADTNYSNLTTTLRVLVNDTTGQHGEGFCPITGAPLPPGGYLSVGGESTDLLGNTFTLDSVTKKATIRLDGENYRAITGRQFIRVCGTFRNSVDFSVLFLFGRQYGLSTDAGIGFVVPDDAVTSWLDVGRVPAGQTRSACDVWEIPGTASTVIVAFNSFQTNPALFSVDLP